MSSLDSSDLLMLSIGDLCFGEGRSDQWSIDAQSIKQGPNISKNDVCGRCAVTSEATSEIKAKIKEQFCCFCPSIQASEKIRATT